MKFIKKAKNSIACFSLIFVFALIFVLQTNGQSRTVDSNVSSQTNQITAEENFELNISGERITETNFVRSTDVALNEPARANLRLNVGVAVRADRIDVSLRGVSGRVRFRGSLETVKRKLEKVQNNLP